MDVFDRYAPFVQDYIYRNRWENLRGIQVAAAEAIFGTDENLLLTASTASGKTEAAFFPILTRLWEDPPATIGAIYIGPLKALINDQFIRLEELCREGRISRFASRITCASPLTITSSPMASREERSEKRLPTP